jgi:sec-independent protein translocase protein TatB
MARNATGDLSKELGTDIQLEDLHPKTFLRKHLLSEEDEAALRKPLQGIYDDVRGVADQVKRDADAAASAANSVTSGASTPAPPRQSAIRASWDDVT